jgi:hypothetical protein
VVGEKFAYVTAMGSVPSHAEIIALWPKPADFARAIGVKRPAALRMKARGISPRHFEAVVEAVAKAGFPPITYAELVACIPKKREANGEETQD